MDQILAIYHVEYAGASVKESSLRLENIVSVNGYYIAIGSKPLA
jgi:hypothetical protein